MAFEVPVQWRGRIFTDSARIAGLIGPLADINYLRKQSALFNESRETGMSKKLGYESVADLRRDYPDFFWKFVRPYIGLSASLKKANSG